MDGSGLSLLEQVFHTISTLFAAEGRTVRLLDVRDFLRRQVPGDVHAVAGPQFVSDLSSMEIVPCATDQCQDDSGASVGSNERDSRSCWASLAVRVSEPMDSSQGGRESQFHVVAFFTR
eukprot:Skav217412  [mRNA]  locus=scaffold2674:351162:355722:- [translate_table: standard]